MWQTKSTSSTGVCIFIRRTEGNFVKVVQKTLKASEVGPKEYKRERTEERHQDWQNKPLHGRFLRCTNKWPATSPGIG